MDARTVYIDLTFLTNFAADFLLLFLAGVLSRKRVRPARIALAALTGAVFALFFIIYPESIWDHPLLRLGFGLMMVWLAFYPVSGYLFVRLVGYFYLLTFLAGGVALALASLGCSPLDWHVLPYALLIACIVSVSVERWLTGRAITERTYCSLKIRLGGKVKEGTALIDTGNSLREPISGYPVIVADYLWFKDLLPDEIERQVDISKGNMLEAAASLSGSALAPRVRVIPFSTVEKKGLMMALTVDEAEIISSKRKVLHEKALVALAPNGLDGEKGFQALVPAALC